MTNTKIVLSKVAHSQRLKSFRTSAALILTTLILMVAAATTVASAQTYTDLYNFDGRHGAQSIEPGVLAQGRDGNLYGTMWRGGTFKRGVVFKITLKGWPKVLYNFDNGIHGGQPSSGLTLGTDGNFYGTTWAGGNGYGTIFKITKIGSLTTLYSFTGGTNGLDPTAPPIRGSDGNYYGTTQWGGAYKITSSGIFTPLGSLPSDGPLLLGTDGNFYGTSGGGSYGYGMVFKMTPKGIVTSVYNFDEPFGGPQAVIQGSDGNFYGTSPEGGTYYHGAVYKLTPQGAITVLHNFRDPNYPNDGYEASEGLVQATDGNFYGVTRFGGTADSGVIFRITPAGAYSILYNFDGANGAGPVAIPMQHTNGKIYGLANGGTHSKGVVYSFDVGLAPFVRTVPTSGKVGQAVRILGGGLTGTSDVSFNGTPATFKVGSDTYLTTRVPSGAKTGVVTVTTPSGTLASNPQFRVTPVILNFSPTSGPVGTPITITGKGLTQTTKVAFGGVQATAFTVDSDTQVTATVPTGAKTGHLAITTAGGTTWSPGIFTVTQ